MPTPDEAKKSLTAIIEDFAAFCETHRAASEEDTRAKVIDRMLKEVCGWPEEAISREDRGVRDTATDTENVFTDYRLSLGGKPTIVVEAKREGIAFTFPVGFRKTYSLDGALVSDANIKEAIYQARGYCDDEGIRYAVATNGYAWIIFRAVRDDIPWRKGSARVFPTLEYIRDNFTNFFNLLSHEAVTAGSLHDAFSPTTRASRQLLRVVERLLNAELPLKRNRLNTSLQPLIKLIFEDIADQEQLEVLSHCYVHTGSLKQVANDLDNIFTELIPRFLYEAGARSIGSAGALRGFERTFEQSLSTRKGELFLLLGGIGSGKTTFLRRYQRTTGAQLLNEKALWFAIDFLQAPLDPIEMEPFVWKVVLDGLRSRYRERNFERRKHLHEVFSDNIRALESTVLLNMKRGSSKYNHALSSYLHEWQQDLRTYVPQLLQVSSDRNGLIPVLFIDNVDQLPPEYQAQIFLLAQRLCRIVGSVTVISLREESYYTASIQRAFTAFTNRKFHIASPLFRRMIGSRINYAVNMLSNQKGQTEGPDGSSDDWIRISQFLLIVQGSIFGRNRNIVRFIEAICYGNMRFALQLFSTFLTSGATDVGKMLYIFDHQGGYNVAFHEFVKAIMLGDWAYYKEDRSPIMNVFNVGTERNASHFTGHRILRALLAHRGESTSEGRAFVNVERLVGDFEDVFDNREDVLQTMDRLVQQRLVEPNTRSSETVHGASDVRVTSAGWYYVRYLIQSFAYLDLVLQDTPVDDNGVHTELWQSVRAVDNMADREELKLARVRGGPIWLDHESRFLR